MIKIRLFNKHRVVKMISLLLVVLPGHGRTEGLTYADTVSNADVAMLPPFCRAWKKADSWDEYSQLTARLAKAPNPQHMCPGLNHLNHAVNNLDKAKKRYQLKAAIREFTYVLKHSEEFSSRSVVLVKRGQAYESLSENDKAVEDYLAAIEYQNTHSGNKKIVSVYGFLSDLYWADHNREAALQALNEGLKISPNSKFLLKKKKKFK